MRRPVCWTHRTEDGVKREVRVHFTGSRGIRWQVRRSDDPEWHYDVVPTEEDWDCIEAAMDARYRRRSAPLKDIELVRNLRATAVRGEK